MKNLDYVYVKDELLSIVDSETGLAYTVNANQDLEKFNKIVDALVSKDYTKVLDLLNPAKKVTTYTKGKIKVDNGIITYNGKRVPTAAEDQILKANSSTPKIEPQ